MNELPSTWHVLYFPFKQICNVSQTLTMENLSVETNAIYLKPVPWDWRLIIQLILAIVGILGNSLVIHVFRRSRKLIQSSTNTLIAALATADLITSISIIPHPELSRIPENIAGHFYCKVVHSLSVMWISIVASVFTLTALSIERYAAIAYAVRYRNLFTLKASRVLIIGIWLAASVINTLSFYVTHLHQGQCKIEFPSTGFQIFIGLSFFLVEYFLPVTIMLVTNIRAIQLMQAQARSLSIKKGNVKSRHMLSLLRARRRIIIMLLIVIISFIICWSPDQFAFLAFNLGLVSFQYINGNLYKFFVVLAFTNSCINPIIYTFVNKNFREAVKQHLPASWRQSKYKENALFEIPFDDPGTTRTKISHNGSSDANIETKGSDFNVWNASLLISKLRKQDNHSVSCSIATPLRVPIWRINFNDLTCLSMMFHLIVI